MCDLLPHGDQDNGREGALPVVGMSQAKADIRQHNRLAKQKEPTNKVQKLRAKKCRVCKVEYQPTRPLQCVCSPSCAIEKAKSASKKIEREERRVAKEKLKRRADWMREAQQAFNAFIRERDKLMPCISCGRHHQGQYHAGHYRTVGGNPELRFEELNCSKQCAPCNDHLHGNIVNYRIQLIQRIGLERVEWLEGKHDPKHYSIEDLKNIKATYKQKLKELPDCAKSPVVQGGDE